MALRQGTASSFRRTESRPALQIQGQLPDLAMTQAEVRGRVRAMISDINYQPPMLPRSAMELAALAALPDVPVPRLVAAIQGDLSLTATVLRVANAVRMRGVGTAITTIERAVVQIGTATLRDLAFASSTRAVFLRKGRFGQLLKRCFTHSVAVAVGSAAVAKGAGLDSGTAFVAGMLHDVGKPILLHALEQLPADVGAMALDENAVVGLLAEMHADAGALVATRWSLPTLVHDVCAGHHQIEVGRTGIAAIVEAANLYTRELGLSLTAAGQPQEGKMALCRQGPSLAEADAIAIEMRAAATLHD